MAVNLTKLVLLASLCMAAPIKDDSVDVKSDERDEAMDDDLNNTRDNKLFQMQFGNILNSPIEMNFGDFLVGGNYHSHDDHDGAPEKEIADPNYSLKGVLLPNERLNSGNGLSSPNGLFQLLMQAAGNLVISSRAGVVLWSANADGAGDYFTFERDGDLVCYNKENVAVWRSGTGGLGAQRLVMQNYGVLTLHGSSGQIVWSSSQLIEGDVDGGWSEWGEYGECSKDCGGGKQTRKRACTNPAPQHKGRVCEEQRSGGASETRDCNLHSCSPRKKVGENCYTDGDCEWMSYCIKDEDIPVVAGICLYPCLEYRCAENELGCCDNRFENYKECSERCEKDSPLSIGTDELKLSCGFDDNHLRAANVPSDQDLNSLVLRVPWFTWKNGEVNYYFKGPVTEGDRKRIRDIMDEIERSTCFRYIPHDTQPSDHHLEIQINSVPCHNRFSAYIQPLPDTQIILFHSDFQLTDENGACPDTRLAIFHELMHSFGVMHTHRRQDRDQFITVHPLNIVSGARSQYDICAECETYPGVPYDCDSIMHYGYKTFAKTGVQTMTSRDPSKCKLFPNGPAFQFKEPSENDWKLLKNIASEVCSQKLDEDVKDPEFCESIDCSLTGAETACKIKCKND